MFGIFEFGKPYFGQTKALTKSAKAGGFGGPQFGQSYFAEPPPIRVSQNVGNLVQQPQTCTATGTVTNPKVAAPAGGGGGPLNLEWWRRKLLRKQLAQEVIGAISAQQSAQTCEARGTVRFVGSGSAPQRQQAIAHGSIRFVGKASIQRGELTMQAKAELSFSGSGNVSVSLMPALTDEQLALILLTAIDD